MTFAFPNTSDLVDRRTLLSLFTASTTASATASAIAPATASTTASATTSATAPPGHPAPPGPSAPPDRPNPPDPTLAEPRRRTRGSKRKEAYALAVAKIRHNTGFHSALVAGV